MPGLATTEPAASSVENQEKRVQQAFDHFYNLEYDQALSIFQKLRDGEPNNPTWHNHLATAYLYKQLHVAGVLQGDLFGASNRFFKKEIEVDPELKQGFWDANNAAVRLCERRLKQDEKDQQALYACGVAYATRSTYQGLIERAKLGFLSSANEANDYHARLARLNPRYYDAYLVPGIFDFVLGSLPGPLRFLLYFAGLSGDKQRGLQSVQSTAQWGNLSQVDAKIVLTVMYRREERFADARQLMADLASSFPRNYIFPLEIASLYRAEEKEQEAIRAYERVLADISRGAPGYSDAPQARIHFELGALYRKVEKLESAREHFQKVLGAKGSTPELEKESAQILRQIEAQLQREGQVPSGGGMALQTTPAEL